MKNRQLKIKLEKSLDTGKKYFKCSLTVDTVHVPFLLPHTRRSLRYPSLQLCSK